MIEKCDKKMYPSPHTTSIKLKTRNIEKKITKVSSGIFKPINCIQTAGNYLRNQSRTFIIFIIIEKKIITGVNN